MIYKLITTGFLFLLSSASGLILSKLGRPLNTPLFTLHKLIALGFTIYGGYILYGLIKKNALPAVFIVSGIILILAILGLFVSGTLLSLSKEGNPLFLSIHRILPVAALITAGILYSIIKPLY